MIVDRGLNLTPCLTCGGHAAWFNRHRDADHAYEPREPMLTQDQLDHILDSVIDGFQFGPEHVLSLLGHIDALNHAEPATEVVTREEWEVTGHPGGDYPVYRFVYGQHYDNPEADAKAFVRAIAAHRNTWEKGPLMRKRTVTETPWVPVDMSGEVEPRNLRERVEAGQRIAARRPAVNPIRLGGDS